MLCVTSGGFGKQKQAFTLLHIKVHTQQILRQYVSLAPELLSAVFDMHIEASSGKGFHCKTDPPSIPTVVCVSDNSYIHERCESGSQQASDLPSTWLGALTAVSIATVYPLTTINRR